MIVTKENIIQVAPKCSEELADEIIKAMPKYGIDNHNRVCRFLAQTAHESGGFNRLEENLTYSTKRLMEVWPKRFRTESMAMPFANDPIALGNFVYANRLGNGPQETGDGYRFRGRGIIQITGRENYEKATKAIVYPLMDYPEDAARPHCAALIAGWFWKSKGLNELADVGDDHEITRRINGALGGFADRQKWQTKFRSSIKEA